MAYESILDLHSRLPNTPNVVPRKTRLALGAVPRTKSKSQLVHHICQSCLFDGHLAIFILRLPSTWFRLFVNSLCYNYRHLNTQAYTHTHTVLHKMSTILKLTQSLCIDCGGCSFRGSAPTKQDLAGKKSGFMIWKVPFCAYGNLYEQIAYGYFTNFPVISLFV